MQNSDGLDSEVQKLKTVFKYDDASNLDEMRKAEQAWEKIKAENPEIAAKTQREADEGFDKLMGKIHAMGIKPVTEEEYEREQKKNKREGVRFSRKGKRMLLIAAVVCVMGVGMTIVATANREYKYNVYPMQGEQNRVIKRNTAYQERQGKLEIAYEEIKSTLGIKVLMLNHIPVGMEFEEMIIENDIAVLKFKYNGKNMYVRERSYPVERGVTEVVLSDRGSENVVFNKWLQREVAIEKNVLDTGDIEYSSIINKEESSYYLSGIMEKEEFLKIVQGVSY